VSFSPDGKRLASAGWDRTVKVWDAATGQQAHTLKGHTDGVCGVSFSPDGKRLASAGDKTVKVWDAATGQQAHTLKGHTKHQGGLGPGLQPRRPVPGLGERGPDGEGVGRGHRPGGPHAPGAHRRGP
jgi:hypothetical protein